MKTILLGVSGSIAAYKSADLVNGLTKLGYNVKVVMTQGATQFITPLTLQSLSKNHVYTSLWDENDPTSIQHIDLVKGADLFLVAPATANVIGKLAGGIADDLLSAVAVVISGRIPRLIAPAMNTNMYENPIVQANLDKLIGYGYEEIEPRASLLACGDVGKGAMENIEKIIQKVVEVCPN